MRMIPKKSFSFLSPPSFAQASVLASTGVCWFFQMFCSLFVYVTLHQNRDTIAGTLLLIWWTVRLQGRSHVALPFFSLPFLSSFHTSTPVFSSFVIIWRGASATFHSSRSTLSPSYTLYCHYGLCRTVRTNRKGNAQLYLVQFNRPQSIDQLPYRSSVR